MIDESRFFADVRRSLYFTCRISSGREDNIRGLVMAAYSFRHEETYLFRFINSREEEKTRISNAIRQ